MRSFSIRQFLVLTLFSFLLSCLGFGEEALLTEGDRQALLEKLEEVKAGAGGRAEQRAGNALTAFRGAVGSDDRAHELYLDCVEKVRFLDEKKSSQSFREWKRRHKDREDSPGFRRVLRHQLNWLLLTIEANSTSEEAGGELSSKAISALDSIIGDQELKGDQFKRLESDVTKTVFALAYGVSAKKGWPVSPVKLDEVYKNFILPPLANQKNVASFRSAWGKWIQQEAQLLEAKSQSPTKGERSAGFERFLVEKRPQMLWDLEGSVFKMGDQKGAALAMLKHLEQFAGHKNEVQWTQDFLQFLEPEEEGE